MDMNKISLDDQILNLLYENARYSYSEIAEKVGVSRVAVKNHISEMEEKGIIKGYTVVVDRVPKTSENIKFLMDVTTTVGRYEEILDRFRHMKMLTEVYATTGECRIHAVGVAPNSQSVQLFANQVYRNEEGLKRLECHTVLSTLKDIRGGVNGTEEIEGINWE